MVRKEQHEDPSGVGTVLYLDQGWWTHKPTRDTAYRTKYIHTEK